MTTPTGAEVVRVEPDDLSRALATYPASITQDVLYDAHNLLLVLGHGLIVQPKHQCFVGLSSAVEAADTESLSAALRDPRNCCASLPQVVDLARDAEYEYDPHTYDSDVVDIEVTDDGLYARLVVKRTRLDIEETDYQELLRPAVAPYDCEVFSIESVDPPLEDAIAPSDEFRSELEAMRQMDRYRLQNFFVRISPCTRMPVGRLAEAARSVYALMSALKGGQFDAAAAANLVLIGRPDLLVGLPESDWFEAKSQGYGLAAPSKNAALIAKVELARDVASFANSGTAAILVVGLRTASIDQKDVVKAVTPIKLTDGLERQYLDVIDGRIHPAIKGLRVHKVETANERGLLAVEIPVQPSEYQPFLVHGAIVGDKVEKNFFSIVQRRGDKSMDVTASQVHAALVAGRAMLRDSK